MFAAPGGSTEDYAHICLKPGDHLQQEFVETKNLHAEPVNQCRHCYKGGPQARSTQQKCSFDKNSQISWL